MENHVFSVTVNRVAWETSADGKARFRGERRIVGCNGRIVVAAGRTEVAIEAGLDPGSAGVETSAMCVDLGDLGAVWRRYS